MQSERQALSRQVVGEKEAVDELKSTVRLVVQHATAGTRSMAGIRLETHQQELERTLLAAFESQFPKWKRSLATMLSSFEDWLAGALREELAAVSIRERSAFLAPLDEVRKQAHRALQQFRDRLSDSTLRVFGVPLRTTETEIHVMRAGHSRYPSRARVRPELGTAVAHSAGVADQAAVRRHFARTVSYLIYENLSRLGAQWEEGINGALWSVEKEAAGAWTNCSARWNGWWRTSGEERAPQLRADLERLGDGAEIPGRATEL